MVRFVERTGSGEGGGRSVPASGGHLSNVKSVGSGVLERRIDFGPGYRVYFGRDGAVLVVLLGGSSKQRQAEAISAAKERWSDYRRRRR